MNLLVQLGQNVSLTKSAVVILFCSEHVITYQHAFLPSRRCQPYFIPLLTPSAAEMVYSVKEAHISFDTGFDDDYVPEASDFIVNSVVVVYNEVHNPRLPC